MGFVWIVFIRWNSANRLESSSIRHGHTIIIKSTNLFDCAYRRTLPDHSSVHDSDTISDNSGNFQSIRYKLFSLRKWCTKMEIKFHFMYCFGRWRRSSIFLFYTEILIILCRTALCAIFIRFVVIGIGIENAWNEANCSYKINGNAN